MERRMITETCLLPLCNVLYSQPFHKWLYCTVRGGNLYKMFCYMFSSLWNSQLIHNKTFSTNCRPRVYYNRSWILEGLFWNMFCVGIQIWCLPRTNIKYLAQCRHKLVGNSDYISASFSGIQSSFVLHECKDNLLFLEYLSLFTNVVRI